MSTPTSIGPLTAGLALPFPVLLWSLTGLSAVAAISLTALAHLTRRREERA